MLRHHYMPAQLFRRPRAPVPEHYCDIIFSPAYSVALESSVHVDGLCVAPKLPVQFSFRSRDATPRTRGIYRKPPRGTDQRPRDFQQGFNQDCGSDISRNRVEE
jgi:hypothetical protein